MAQSSDFVVDDGSGTLLLSQLNTMFPALASCNSGATAPPNPYPFMLWGDTSVSPPVLRVRNAANSAWIAALPETAAAKTVRGNSAGSAGAIADISMTTLATMLGFAQSLTAPYYQTLPSGLMLQWGISGSIAAGGGTAISFAATFPTAAHGVIATPITAANNTSVFSVGVRALTTSGAILTNNSGTSGAFTGFWLALGN